MRRLKGLKPQQNKELHVRPDLSGRKEYRVKDHQSSIPACGWQALPSHSCDGH